MQSRVTREISLARSITCGFDGSEPCIGAGWARNCDGTDGGTGSCELWTGIEPELSGITEA